MSVKSVCLNKKARFNYELTDKFEAGLVLHGSEVKSLRAGRCHLEESYVSFRKEEAFLQNAHISPYGPADNREYKPDRLRKLLLHKKEIERIQGLVQQKRMSCVPLRIYFKAGRAKLEFALGIGKTGRDKRETLKRKTADRQMQRALRRGKKSASKNRSSY